MQTDLIKRGEVLKIINEHRGNFNQMEEEIMKLECAYDVEKVIEKIVTLHEEGHCLNEDELECVLDKSCNDCFREQVEKIIRNGGKE